jgi:hypothetical protein
MQTSFSNYLKKIHIWLPKGIQVSKAISGRYAFGRRNENKFLKPSQNEIFVMRRVYKYLKLAQKEACLSQEI